MFKSAAEIWKLLFLHRSSEVSRQQDEGKAGGQGRSSELQNHVLLGETVVQSDPVEVCHSAFSPASPFGSRCILWIETSWFAFCEF